jgi:hypothetical protein
MPCAATVHTPLSVRLVLATIPSPLKRHDPNSGGDVAHTSPRPCMDQAEPGRDAKEPERAVASVDDEY